eukprot:gene1698-1892_t
MIQFFGRCGGEKDQIFSKISRRRPDFKSQKDRDKLHICELHFTPEDIERCVDKKVKFGRIPTQNFPTKSFEREAKPRASSAVQIEKRKTKEFAEEQKPKRVYSLNAYRKGLKKHAVAKNIDPFEDDTVAAEQENGKEFFRSKNCQLLSTSAVCDSSKSPPVYEELRSSGVLKLPIKRTLRDYKNVVKTKQGISEQTIEELESITKSFFDVQRYIVVLFDEVKIKDNLDWDKYTGNLLGFVDLGDPDINFDCIEEERQLATHMLVIYIRGICTDLKYPFANFATNTATSSQLFPIFWNCLFYLEISCNLWVVAVVSDGASANRKFYKLHDKVGNQTTGEVTYRVMNLYAKHWYIYFFADAPHLMKTSRNCLNNSGFDEIFSRLMWNGGKYLVWSHLMKFYNDDRVRGLHIAPKLTYNHLHLNPYAKMKVYLAVQILSATVAKVMVRYYPVDFHGTAKFCEMTWKGFVSRDLQFYGLTQYRR